MASSRRRALGLVAALLAVVVGPDISDVFAAPITSITDLANFRETIGLNDLGLFQGELDSFGAQVVPNGLTGTTIFATQGAVRIPAASGSSFACNSLTVSPNSCGLSSVFSGALTGPWQLTFSNGADQASATTPAFTASAISGPAPFPVSVTISGTGPTPTLSWTVPGGFNPDVVRINVFDKNKTTNTGSPDIIFSQQLAGNAKSAVIGSNANLQPSVPYVFQVQLIETRDHTANTGSPNANISKRSDSFSDFQVLGSGETRKILLPTLGPTPSPSTGLGATYQFNVANIQAGQQIFIDPLVAVGYKYATAAGNPNFASVLLPAVQAGKFTVSFLAGQTIVQQILDPNVQFFFPGTGVAAFDVTGIDPLASLDPGNVTAFVTGLTFEGDGDFTGTMTPIIADLAATPEPAALLLWGTTMAGLGLTARWRRRGQQ